MGRYSHFVVAKKSDQPTSPKNKIMKKNPWSVSGSSSKWILSLIPLHVPLEKDLKTKYFNKL
jgi:hypothetical protein